MVNINSKIENYNNIFTSFSLNIQSLGLLIAEKEDSIKIEMMLKNH